MSNCQHIYDRKTKPQGFDDVKPKRPFFTILLQVRIKGRYTFLLLVMK